MAKMDLTGDTYNNLTVLQFSHRTPKNSMAHYKCKCKCGNVVTVSHGHLRSGHTKSCGCIKAETVEKLRQRAKETAKYFVGQRFFSKKWGVAIVKALPTRFSNKKATIEFVGEHPCEVEASLSNLAKGFVKNPMKPVVCGKGYIGVGKYDTKGEAYDTWYGMLYRCYTDNEETQRYVNTTVCSRWLNFQNFAEDYSEMLAQVNVERPQLDKDLLSGLDRGLLYSKETCCILPHRINTALQMVCTVTKVTDAPCGVSLNRQTGKYKAQISRNGKGSVIGSETTTIEAATIKYRQEKSKYLADLAEEYKYQLPARTYSALVNKSKEILNEIQ